MKRRPAQTLAGIRLSVASTMLSLLFGSPAWCAELWPQFRGLNGDGIAPESAPPVEWSPEKNIHWSIDVPGTGWSQPVVWGNRIFVTTAVAEDQPRPNPNDWGPGGGLASFLGFTPRPPATVYRWNVLCFELETGEVLWERTAREGRPTTPVHRNNTYASETPATDGERLIASFGSAGVYCYGMDGELQWSYGPGSFPTQLGWGTGSSPVLDGERVFLQYDNERASFLVALDKRSGREIWRVDRDEKSNWSTPFLWKNKLRTELVTAGGTRMRSYDPATGDLLWEMAGHGRTAMTPTGDESLVYLDSSDKLTGRTGVLAAVRAGASGDISLARGEQSSEHVAWSVPLSAYRVASPLLYDDGGLYILEQQSGIIRCFDAQTGALRYRSRFPGATGSSASPVAAAGRVYCLDQNGLTTVLQPGGELRVLAENQLDRDMYWASPAIAGDRILVRSSRKLFCIAAKAPHARDATVLIRTAG